MVASMHPQAKFDPIPPDLDLKNLVDETQNFKWVQRVPRNDIRKLGPQGFEHLVQLYVIERGQPLVIEGWDAVFPKDDKNEKRLFSVDWLEEHYDKKRRYNWCATRSLHNANQLQQRRTFATSLLAATCP